VETGRILQALEFPAGPFTSLRCVHPAGEGVGGDEDRQRKAARRASSGPERRCGSPTISVIARDWDEDVTMRHVLGDQPHRQSPPPASARPGACGVCRALQAPRSCGKGIIVGARRRGVRPCAIVRGQPGAGKGPCLAALGLGEGRLIARRRAGSRRRYCDCGIASPARSSVSPRSAPRTVTVATGRP
jgi:hypothetical protein